MMTPRTFPLVSSLLALSALGAGACAARTLDAGSTDAGSASSASTITYLGGCAPASCAQQAVGCAARASVPQQAVNVRCVPDPNAGIGSDPAGACALQFECADDCAARPAPSCGTDSSGPSLCAGVTGGSGTIAVVLAPATPSSPASTGLFPYFDHGRSGSTAQSYGACVYDPYGARHTQSGVAGAAAPNPGTVTIATAGNALSLSATPVCDGTYAAATTAQSFAGGDVVAFSFLPPANDPDRFPSVLPSVPAPHPVALSAGQALAASAPSVPRSSDLLVSYAVSGSPMALEQVVVLLTQGQATLTCAFDPEAGAGVVPADALLRLGTAPASYQVSSRHATAVTGGASGWDLRLVVDAVATTPAGLASGALRLL